MASVLGLALLVLLIGLHTLVAAVMTRFFRLRLDAWWSVAVYVAFLIPVVLLASTLLLTGFVGIGVDLGSPTVVIVTLIVVPTALGAAVDVLYVEHPDEYELPEPAE